MSSGVPFVTRLPATRFAEARECGRIVRVENLEVLFFTSRLLRRELFSLPIVADLRQMEAA